MEPADYLKRPYGRVVVPEADGSFRGEIIEFPGCIALGDTAAEALANLEDVATSWLAAKIAKKLPVPEPMEGTDYSGKLVDRLGRDLHRRASYIAAHQGISLNQFIANGVAERIGTFARTLMLYERPATVLNDLTIKIGFQQQALLPGGESSVSAGPATATVLVPQWQDEKNA